MSNDYLLLTPTAVTLTDVLRAVRDVPDATLRADSSENFAVLIRNSDHTPLLWCTGSMLIADWDETLRLLPREMFTPPSQHLVYWTELHSPSSAPELAGSTAMKLAADLQGWAAHLEGDAHE